MINQLSNKYLVKKLVVYLDNGLEAGVLLDLFEMIDQLSKKYLYIHGLPCPPIWTGYPDEKKGWISYQPSNC